MLSGTYVPVLTCPICREPVQGLVAVDVKVTPNEEGIEDEAQLSVSGEVTGISFQHDCRPKSVRR